MEYRIIGTDDKTRAAQEDARGTGTTLLVSVVAGLLTSLIVSQLTARTVNITVASNDSGAVELT